MLRTVVDACEDQHGFPHLCGTKGYAKVKWGKKGSIAQFAAASRAHLKGDAPPVTCGFSAGAFKRNGTRNGKAGFIVRLTRRFINEEMPNIGECSDREVAVFLHGIEGVGDWCAGRVLQDFLCRGDLMLSTDLTVRNYLNDMYDIGHNVQSETQVASAADFPPTAQNRYKMDHLADENGWKPYRTVVSLLMYFLQEENLVLL